MKLNIPESWQRFKAGPKRRLYGATALVAGIALVAWLVAGIVAAWLAHGSQTLAGLESASPLAVVAVAAVHREDLYKEIKIPAEFRPYVEVQLHAKVSGFLRQMNVDIGDRVKAGQLLATLEVPELQDQLNHAIATEQRAEADATNALLVYSRLVAVNKDHPNLVAQQDLDTAEAKKATSTAEVAAAKSDRERYQTLSAYTKITAPFDGVVTHRYADPGALIQAGTASDTQTMPLVRISDNYRLRLDFPVSVTYVNEIHVGDTVEGQVESLGGEQFTGTISRFTGKVDDDTRTMITEVEVPNAKLELMPGMYASVILKVQRRPRALAVPTEAIASSDKSTVYVVNGNQEIEERTVKLGLETPAQYEVLSGLNEGDSVVIGSRAAVKPGQRVESKVISLSAAP